MNGIQKVASRGLSVCCSLNIEDLLREREKLDEKIGEQFGEDVTILFTDIVNYTAFVETYGDIDAKAMLQKHNRVAFPLIAKYRGLIIKTIGDSIMASFGSPPDAVRAAIEIQDALANLKEHNENRKIRVRIGINRGTALRDGKDLFGDAVNVAARIEPKAKPGQILVSKSVYEAVRDIDDIVCCYYGKEPAKGKSAPLELYRVLLDDGDDDEGPANGSRALTGRVILGGASILVVLTLLGIIIYSDIPGQFFKKDEEVSTPDSHRAFTPYSPKLRSIKARNDELLTAFERHTGDITENEIKHWLTLKVGFKNEANSNPDLESRINAFLDRIPFAAKSQTGVCDLLLTLVEYGQGNKLVVRNNTYGNEMVDSNREVLTVDNWQPFFSRLEAVINRDWCFNALRALQLLNPVHDESSIELELSGKSGRMFQVGDIMNACVSSSKQTYCMLYNVNLDGIYLLFPRLGKERNLLKAGETQCSGNIEVSPPTGNELLLAILFDDNRLLPSFDYRLGQSELVSAATLDDGRDLPSFTYSFSQDEPFFQWSYTSFGPDNAVAFCERLLSSLSNESHDKWLARSMFIKTY
ncbi:MAG: adenylate/guanylate cyclase domain-containing protein [Thermodesulfobacteriota bacterium]|nr:adenylate/guanylate cyclase domain-containing protein [Thermodesulfobacteriota bacterium]